MAIHGWRRGVRRAMPERRRPDWRRSYNRHLLSDHSVQETGGLPREAACLSDRQVVPHRRACYQNDAGADDRVRGSSDCPRGVSRQREREKDRPRVGGYRSSGDRGPDARAAAVRDAAGWDGEAGRQHDLPDDADERAGEERRVRPRHQRQAGRRLRRLRGVERRVGQACAEHADPGENVEAGAGCLDMAPIPNREPVRVGIVIAYAQ